MTPAILLCTLLAGPGCAPAPIEVQQEPVAEMRVVAPASSMLAFARWVADASGHDLQAVRPALERAVTRSDDITSDIRLALVLHALPEPDADPPRARHLLDRFLSRAESPQHDDLRNLAAILLRNWREQARLVQVHEDSRVEAAQERAGRERERERRLLAEKRLDALIKVERRVKRTTDPITEVKPVPR